MQTKHGSNKIRREGSRRSSATEKEPDTTHQPSSSNSTVPSDDSKQVWKQPRTVREFASQVNAVASRVLNGRIDLETARTYSGLARVVAQSVSSEVTKARFAKQAPDMSFDSDDVFEEEKENESI